MFKTYEGELRTGGLYDGDGTMTSSEWPFSVSGKNKEAIENLDLAIKNGFRVSLTYEEKFFTLPWNGETKYFVTKVEVLENHGGNFPQRQTPLPQSQQDPAPKDTSAVL